MNLPQLFVRLFLIFDIILLVHRKTCYL
uniref:Uncharacterized protein n=1 Tax=Rhizophora mucronata TaxID=61149 RepID=A0A2P2PHI8_RHIMU